MNKRIIALVIGIFILLGLGEIVFTQDEPFTQYYEELYRNEDFWGTTTNYNDIRWEFVDTEHYKKVEIDWSGVTYTYITLSEIPSDKWADCDTCVDQSRITGEKVGEIPVEYFDITQINEEDLEFVTAEQISTHFDEIIESGEFNFVALDPEVITQLFKKELEINLEIIKGEKLDSSLKIDPKTGKITIAKIDPLTGKIIGKTRTFEPSEYPKDKVKLIAEGNQLKIIPLKEDGAEDPSKTITISGDYGGVVTRDENGNINIELGEGESITVSGEASRTVTVILEDGTRLGVFSEEDGSLTVNSDGDILEANNAVAARFDDSIEQNELEGYQRLQEYIQDKIEAGEDVSIKDTLIEVLGISGDANFNLRKIIYESNPDIFGDAEFEGTFEQNSDLVTALLNGNIQLPTQVYAGRFETEGDASLLNSYPGGHSRYYDFRADLKAGTSAPGSLAIVNNLAEPPEDWDFNGYVSYSYNEETGERSFATIGAVDMEYDGVKVQTTETIRNGDFDRVHDFLVSVQQGEVIDWDDLDGVETPLAYHDNRRDVAYGIILVEDDGMRYEGLKTTTRYTKTFDEEKNRDIVWIDADENGDIARLTKKVMVGDLSEEDFVTDQKEIPLYITKTGDEVLVDIKAEELLAVLGYFTDPTKFRFALLDTELSIILGDPEKGAGFFITQELGMLYQPSEGLPVSVLPPHVMIDYLGEEHKPLMIGKALIQSRERFTSRGFIVGDRVSVNLGKHAEEEKIVEGTIIDIANGEILIDTDDDGKPDVSIMDDSRIVRSDLSEEDLAERLEIYNNKPREVLELLNNYEREYIEAGHRRGAEARLLMLSVINEFDLPLGAGIFDAGDEVYIGGEKRRIVKRNLDIMAGAAGGGETTYEFEGGLVLSDEIVLRENWLGEFAEDYSSHTDLLQEGGLEIANQFLEDNDIGGALRFYENVVDINPSSQFGEDAKRTRDLVISLESLERALYMTLYRERKNRATLRGEGGGGILSDFFGAIGKAAPLEILKILSEDIIIDERHEHMYESLHFAKALIERGRASNLEEVITIMKKLAVDPSIGFEFKKIDEYLSTRTISEEDIEKWVSEGNEVYTAYVRHKELMREYGFDYEEMITSRHMSFLNSEPSLMAGHRQLTSDIDSREEILGNMQNGYKRQDRDFVVAVTAYNIVAQLTNPVAWITYGTISAEVAGVIGSTAAGLRLLTTAGKVINWLPSRLGRGLLAAGTKIFLEEIVIEEGIPLIVGAFIRSPSVYKATGALMIGFTGGADSIDLAQVAVKRAFEGIDLELDTDVHIDDTGRILSRVYDFDGDVATLSSRLRASGLGDIEVHGDTIEFTNPRTGEKMFFVKRGSSVEFSDGHMVSRKTISDAIGAQHVYTESLDALALAGVGCGSFVVGTKIAMYDGTLKNIENIKKGDIVLSYDIEKKVYVSGKVVSDAIVREVDKLIIVNEKIKTTPEHPFFVLNKNRYIGAEDLSIGDILLGSDRDNVIVRSIKIEKPKEKILVYNFDVDDNSLDSYFAGGILVHNTNVCLKSVVRDLESRGMIDVEERGNDIFISYKSGGEIEQISFVHAAQLVARFKTSAEHTGTPHVLVAGLRDAPPGYVSYDLLLKFPGQNLVVQAKVPKSILEGITDIDIDIAAETQTGIKVREEWIPLNDYERSMNNLIAAHDQWGLFPKVKQQVYADIGISRNVDFADLNFEQRQKFYWRLTEYIEGDMAQLSGAARGGLQSALTNNIPFALVKVGG